MKNILKYNYNHTSKHTLKHFKSKNKTFLEKIIIPGPKVFKG
jgi:hypothetical protein